MEKLIFDKRSNNGNTSIFPEYDDVLLAETKDLLSSSLFQKITRTQPIGLPSLSELEVVRHYTKLSQLNFCVDTNFYPLGSCTMKYNPKINEDVARLQEFCMIHPFQSEHHTQGILALLYDFEQMLCSLTGMHCITLQASAGAHGELTGMLIAKKYFATKKELNRTKIIVPDSSHGTNPATGAMCGFDIVKIESTASGLVDIEKLKQVMDENTAAIMLTNPNTLGLFEEDILEIKRIVHEKGGLIYYDGANFNALSGIIKPSSMGFDILHLNLHKTFSTPHGGGGPGSAAVGVNKELSEYLPAPIIKKKDNTFFLNYELKHSIGKVRSFYGNISVAIKAYAYLLRLGKDIKNVAYHSVLNANYIREQLKDVFEVCSDKPCMHEVVFSAKNKKESHDISAMDIAKRLIDYGIHPPTVYFPLIIKEALMIEPTETESKETLDLFCDIMRKINDEIQHNPQLLKNAPSTTCICRPDEAKAARTPDIRWNKK